MQYKQVSYYDYCRICFTLQDGFEIRMLEQFSWIKFHAQCFIIVIDHVCAELKKWKNKYNNFIGLLMAQVKWPFDLIEKLFTQPTIKGYFVVFIAYCLLNSEYLMNANGT